MRPVLFTVGPWPWWVLPLLALALGLVLWLWERLERGLAPRRPATWADRLGPAAFAVVGAVALYLLVNRLAPLPVRSYGVMLLVGLLAGLAWMGYSGRREGLGPAALVDFAACVLVGGILGARLVFVLLDWSSFAPQPLSALRVWEGGLSFHGGLGGGLLAAYLFCRWRHLRFGMVADLGAPALALGYAFTRIGCFLNGCCFGGHCASWLGVRFGPDSEAAQWGLGLAPGQPATTWGPRLYPTQLFHAWGGILIFYLLVLLRPRMRRPGHLFWLFLVFSGVERFVVEFWRHGASGRPNFLWPALTDAQVFSALLIVVAGAYLLLTWPRGQARSGPEAD